MGGASFLASILLGVIVSFGPVIGVLSFPPIGFSWLYIRNLWVFSDFVGLVHISVSPVDLGAVSHIVTVVLTLESRRT